MSQKTYVVKARVLYAGLLVVEAHNANQAESEAKSIIDSACTFDEDKVPVNAKSLQASDAQEIDPDVFTLPPCPGSGTP